MTLRESYVVLVGVALVGVVCGLGVGVVVAVVGLDVDRGHGLGFVVWAYTYL